MSEQTTSLPEGSEGKSIPPPEKAGEREPGEAESETDLEKPEFVVSREADASSPAVPDISGIPDEKKKSEDFRSLMGVGEEEKVVALQVLANPNAYLPWQVEEADRLLKSIEQNQRNKNE